MDSSIIVVVFYFLAVLLLGIYSSFKIKTPSDYYIAGKNAGLTYVSGSLLATILGGSAILGTIELGQNTGWPALWFLFCASLGLFALAPLARYVNRHGKFTLPGLLGKFYGEKVRKFSSLVIPFAWLGIIAAQIIAASHIIAGLGIISYSEGALLSGGIFIAYTLFGGQVSILKTDFIQSILIISGLAVLIITALKTPEAASLPALDTHAMFNESFTVTNLIVLVLTYSVTFVVGPDIYSRLFCAKNEKTATRSILIVAFILIPISFGLTFIGVYSGKIQSTELMSFARELLPGWYYGLFVAALLSAIMSSADTTLLTSSLILSELFHKNLEDKKAFRLTRLLIVVLGILSIIIALFVTSILQSLLLALTFFSGAFVIPMLAGLLHINVIREQVIPAIFTGGIIALAGKIISLSGLAFTGNLIIILAFPVNACLLFIRTGLFKSNT